MASALKSLILDRPAIRGAVLRAVSLVRSLDRAGPGLYTLLYHRIPAAHQDRFDAQLAFFRRFGRFVAADEAADAVRSGWTGRDRAFLVSFDDGYADSVDVALPVLRAHGIPAIQFLVSDWLDAPPASADRRDGYMTPRDVGVWAAAGMDVGSHSASHPRFSRLSEAEARSEFERSRDALGRLTGKPVRHFACPWGVAAADFSPDRDPGLARACGYETFYTTRRGRAVGPSDLFGMPRHVVEPDWALHEVHARVGGWRRD